MNPLFFLVHVVSPADFRAAFFQYVEIAAVLLLVSYIIYCLGRLGKTPAHIQDLGSKLVRLLFPGLEIRTRLVQLGRIQLLLVARLRTKEPRVGFELIPLAGRRPKGLGILRILAICLGSSFPVPGSSSRAGGRGRVGMSSITLPAL